MNVVAGNLTRDVAWHHLLSALEQKFDLSIIAQRVRHSLSSKDLQEFLFFIYHE